MRFTCRIPKAAETHPEYVIFVACTRQQLLRERASVTFIRTLSVLLPIKPQGLAHTSSFWRLVCKFFHSRHWKLLKNKKPTWCHLLFYFTSYVLNMFRTLIYPSSGACDCVVELPHRSSCSLFVVCWSFGAAGFGWCSFCRLKLAALLQLYYHRTGGFICAECSL